MRTCTGCGIAKDQEFFYASNPACCKECIREAARRYRARPDVQKKTRAFGGYKASDAERAERDVRDFWKFVVKGDGCWRWIGPFSSDGYGRFYSKLSRRRIRAHRYSLELAIGKIPDDRFACHRCDNPACVNPDHLFVGTAQENIRDMASKGRSCAQKHPEKFQGERNGRSKLTEDQVREIKAKRLAGIPRTQIAKEYGVSKTVIYHIDIGKLWKHVAA